LGLLSCPLKGESCVTSWGCNRVSAGGGRLGHGGVFEFFLLLRVFFFEKKERREKFKVGPKKLQCVFEHRPSLG
jgi:hypothetical protein